MKIPKRSGIEMRKILRVRDQIFVGSFLVSVLLTLFLTLWMWGTNSKQQSKFRAAVFESESRWMKSPLRPLVAATRGVRLFISGYRDYCALNAPFIRWNGLFKTQYLKTSTSPEVILGKNNWLFLNTEGSLDDYRRLHPFTPGELSHLKKHFENQNRFLNQRSIRFLVIVPPDKQTIYPELMPDSLAPVPGQTHLDQFLEVMKDSPVPILDLRAPLRQAKRELGVVYYRDDSHWNDRGAYVAYAATVQRLKKWYPALREMKSSGMQVQKSVRRRADLPGKIGIPDDIAENVEFLTPKPPLEFPDPQPVKQPDSYYMKQVITQSPRGEVPRALVFGDSFFFLTSYMPYLSQHFRYAQWNWMTMNTSINEDLVRRTKPDLVILERVERIIFSVPGSAKIERDKMLRQKGGLP